MTFRLQVWLSGYVFFFFQAEDGIRDLIVTGVQTCALPILWTLLLLIPVLYVNQEMVVRLGAVTGVGHARLILERFGKFWGAFSVIDLFILNALTIVTEFIGITLAAGYLGVPKVVAVVLAAGVIVAAA